MEQRSISLSYINHRDQKKRFPVENRGKSRNMLVLGAGGVWGPIFTVNCKRRVARKLCRIILLHLGLITSNFHFLKRKNVLISTNSGPRGRDPDSQNQLCLTLETPNYFNKCKNSQNYFRKSYVWKLSDLGRGNVRTDACQQILEVGLINS